MLIDDLVVLPFSCIHAPPHPSGVTNVFWPAGRQDLRQHARELLKTRSYRRENTCLEKPDLIKKKWKGKPAPPKRLVVGCIFKGGFFEPPFGWCWNQVCVLPALGWCGSSVLPYQQQI